jgi:hypothetical protein
MTGKSERAKYALKLTNIVQDAYGCQHPDGLLSEFDVDGLEWSDPHKVKLFDTKEEAEHSASHVGFFDSPSIEVVEIQCAEKGWEEVFLPGGETNEN